MKVVVVGYGRVGSALARELGGDGHQVTVIDNQSSRVQRAARLANVKVIAGNAVDVQVQRDAGVSGTDVFLAVTANDNVNLVSAQIALEMFQVPHVFARVYVPSRAELTAERGVQSVCPTHYTIETLLQKAREVGDETATQPVAMKRHQPRQRPQLQPTDESKFVVVAGGGRVGFHLARALIKNGHEVAVIESNAATAGEIKARLDCPVIVGDGSMTPVLEEAGVSRARVFAAVTGQDEDNLVACQAARMLSKSVKTIARVSNPTNEELYKALGVNSTISATSLIENVIERELPTLHIKTLLSLPGGTFNILELTLTNKAPVIDRPLRDIVLPRDTNVVAILRNQKTVVPRGDTVFKTNDVVITLVGKESEEALKRTLLGGDEPEGEHSGEIELPHETK